MSWPDRERIRVLIIERSEKLEAGSWKLEAMSLLASSSGYNDLALQASSFKLQASESRFYPNVLRKLHSLR